MHLLENKLECGYGGVTINRHNLIIIKVVFKSRNRWSSYMLLVQRVPCRDCVWYKRVEVSIRASIRLINYKGMVSSVTIISTGTKNI